MPPSQMLFGSDFPAEDPANTLYQLKQRDLPPDVAHALYRGNAERLFPRLKASLGFTPVAVDLEALREQFEGLFDEGLLSIDRKDLIEVAQQYYDAEIARRGLQDDPAAAEEDSAGEELVPVATFSSLQEADLSRALLRSADIPANLENELSSTWSGIGGVRLMVPASFLEQAEEILGAQISDEELLAQAEAAESVEDVPGEEEDE